MVTYTQQVFRPNNSGELPEWFNVEAYYAPTVGDWCLRALVRCRDGDQPVFDLPIYVRTNPGRSQTLTLFKRELLEAMQAHIATELAKIELEE